MDSVVIYRSHVEMMDELLKNDKDWREAMTGLIKYGFEGKFPETDNSLISAVYKAAQPTIKKSREKYMQKCIESLCY